MNYILIKPQIKNQLISKFNEYNNTLNKDLTFKEFLQITFNNSNRGILYNKISDTPLKIKIWAPNMYMVLQEIKHKNAFEIIYLKEMTLDKFNSMLQHLKLLKGNWDFALMSSDIVSDGDYNYLREEEAYNENKDRFDDFHKYWLNYDLITQKREEKSKEKERLSLTKYNSIAINFDKENAIIKCESNNYQYKSGDRVRISYNNPSVIYKGPFIIGEVEEHKKLSKQIVVKCNSLDMLNELYFNKNYENGFIYLDDIGTMVMLKRQKEALKKLFNRDTANKRLKDFIPNIENANNITSIFNNEIDFTDSLKIMNEFQTNAVKGALGCNDIYLIQGPPGTGKTTVICEIIKQITNGNNDVLVSSQNHLAVDNVLQRIGDENSIRAIRIGDEEKIELGCEKYLLSNRVKNIQDDIKRSLNNFKKDNEYIYDEINNIKNLVVAYENSKDKIILLNNLLINFAEHNKIKEKLIEDLAKEKRYKAGVEEQINKLVDIPFYNHSLFEDLIKYINEYEINRDFDNTIGEKIISVVISNEDIKNINEYRNIVDILENEIKEHSKIKEEKKRMINELEDIETRYENVKEIIISLGFQYEETNSNGIRVAINNKIDEMTEELELLKSDYREKQFDIKAINYKIKEQLNTIYQWDDKANEYKNKIEEVLIRNSHVCKSKAELMDLIKFKEYLLDKFNNNDECFNYIKYLNDYKKGKSIRKELDSANELILEIEKKLSREDKMISNIKNRINEYSQLNDIQYIIGNENISIYDLDNSVIEKIDKLSSKLQELSRKQELIENTEDIREQLLCDLENYQGGFEDMYVGVSNVVCATCSGIAGASNNYFMEREFEYVIIDEAAKCFSSELLIPMIRGKKIILVGDHKQLSPIIEKEILLELEQEEHVAKDEKQLYYNNSLFGIMFDKANDNIKSTLKKQYRMNNDISSFISSQFYKNELIDGENIIDINNGIMKMNSGLYWVNTGDKNEGLESLVGNSYYNELETDIIIDTLKWLNKNVKGKKEVGIISPYKAQKDYLLEQILGLDFENIEIEINTIDAFQGREKQIVIMNCVRNNENGEFGHVSGDARVNVAVSRAQELLIVIGNESFIKTNRGRARSLYNLLKYTEENRCKLNREFFIKDNTEEVVEWKI